MKRERSLVLGPAACPISVGRTPGPWLENWRLQTLIVGRPAYIMLSINIMNYAGIIGT